jgi:cytochrome c551/c552
MKITRLILGVCLCFVFSTALGADQQGETIFKSKGCAFCHKQGGPSSGSIPSLPELAKAYNGRKAQLIQYFQGNADPIVRPERAISMKRPLKKTMALSDAGRAALADYILNR